ncbi:MAG: TRAP transporter small permease subunit [Desulfobacterales bacterium]
MDRLQRLSDSLNTAVERVLFVIGSGICLILFAQVVFRYAGASIGWSEEVSRHLLVAITFLGGTSAYKRASLIGLRGFGHRMGPGAEAAIRIALQAMAVVGFVVLLWFSAAYTVKAWEHTTASAQIPMAIPFASIPLAMAIFLVHGLAGLQRLLGPKRS